ncbi:MAG: glutamate racemase [Eggerthellaceae bacterium]|nr:glutamate racemase [Eggerthellaceae bacterium]
MSEAVKSSFIGVFDSGAGGISVLRALVAELPHEHFRYFGDSAHAPYGDLGEERIRELSVEHATRMINEGAKAIVIACNTATSAAAQYLREMFPELPIIGIEPALKPAALAGGRILVLATEATVHLEKYHVLAATYGADDMTTVACSGLVELIEAGNLDDPAIEAYLQEKIGHLRGQVDSVVLGCTHYPFLKRQISEVLGDVAFFDGAEGTARNLRRRLVEHDLLAPEEEIGTVSLASSIPGQVELYQRLLNA